MKVVTGIPVPPERPADGHKGTFGTVVVIAGSRGMLGAAILSARGALRGGAGLVRVSVPEDLQDALAVAVPCATSTARSAPEDAVVRRELEPAAAVVIGPGLGETPDTREHVGAVLRCASSPVVLDADALNALAAADAALQDGPPGVPIVATPHPGEAARLLGIDARAVQADREAAAAELAQRFEVAVLKGAGTLVCDGERLFRNFSGNAGMGTGGSGDVLAGLLGAFIAQGMDPFDAAVLAVNVHGRAGDLVAQRLSPHGLIAQDLPLAIAEVLGS